MKNNKILKILLVISILFININIVSSALTNGIIGSYSFDTDCTDDSVNSRDCTPVNSPTHISNTDKCIVGNGCYWLNKADTEYFTIPDHSDFDANNRCVVVHYRTNSTGLTQYFYSENAVWVQFLNSNDEWRTQAKTPISFTNAITTVTSSIDTDYQIISCHIVGTGTKEYVNGYYRAIDNTKTGNLENPTGSMYIGGQYVGSNTMEGIIDQVIIYNRSLDDDSCTINTECGGEIAELYNNGDFINPFESVSVGVTPSCTIISNFTNIINYSFSTHINTIIGFNVSVSSVNNSNAYELNLTIAGYNKTWGVLDFSSVLDLNFTGDTLENISSEFILIASNENTTCNFNMSNTVIDFVNPDLVTNFVNNSIFNITEGNTSTEFEYQYNFFDNNLDGFILETENLDLGTTIEFKTVEGITITTYMFNQSLPNNNLTTGMTTNTENDFRINVTFWDSHTANKIKFDYDLIDNGIIFDNQIKIYSDYVIDVTPYKYVNKYNFLIVFNESRRDHYIYLKSTQNLDYLEKSSHKLHFIDRKNKKWIDFKSKPTSRDHIVTRIDENTYRIDFTFKDEVSEVLFKSIGDLNVVNEYYFFTVSYTEEETLNTYYLSFVPLIYNLLDEVLNLILEIFIIGLFLVLALIFKNALFLALSSFGWILMFIRTMIVNSVVTDYDLILGIVALVLSFVFAIGGLVWFWIQKSNNETETKQVKKRGLQRIYN